MSLPNKGEQGQMRLNSIVRLYSIRECRCFWKRQPYSQSLFLWDNTHYLSQWTLRDSWNIRALDGWCVLIVFQKIQLLLKRFSTWCTKGHSKLSYRDVEYVVYIYIRLGYSYRWNPHIVTYTEKRLKQTLAPLRINLKQKTFFTRVIL